MMYLSVVVKMVAGFIGLLVVMRVVGKKSFSHITPYDLIYTLVLGGIIAPGLYSKDVHIGHILFAMAIWGLLIYFVEVSVQKNNNFTKQVKGKPAVLIEDGQLNLAEIRKNHIEMEQLRALLRSQNCFSLENAEFALLEISGSLSVIPKTEGKPVPTYLLINEKKVQMHALNSIGKNREWLITNLERKGYTNLDEIVYAEWSEKNGLYVKKYTDSQHNRPRIDN